ncbi:MAG: hypothetical protein ACHBNF_21640 [Chromatiales bacterium]
MALDYFSCDDERGPALELQHMLARVVAGGVERGVAMCAINMIPAFKRALVRRAMGLRGPLPRLGRGLPL